jgi:two-component system sensor histidine kinase/response regulator
MNRVLRILFVEDMPDIQKVGLRMFQAAGHRVYLATNGREAVDIFEREPVDLVVMDLQMPEMDGWQAAREIRRREQAARGVPIIAVSAYTQQAEPERIRAAGIDAFIAKPLDNNRLLQTIDALCAVNSD